MDTIRRGVTCTTLLILTMCDWKNCQHFFLNFTSEYSRPGHKLIGCFEKGFSDSGQTLRDADTRRCCERANLECRYRSVSNNPGNICLNLNLHDVDLPRNVSSEMDKCCEKAGAVAMKIPGYEDVDEICK